jgi:hypothetical protein
MCLRTVSQKISIFYGQCQKEKLSLTKKILSISLNYYFYTTQITNRFLIERFLAQIACEDIHEKFC